MSFHHDLTDARKALSKDELGAWGESCAASYLVSSGYRVLARNWRCRGGELDIVAFDPARDAIVGVEVKTRRGHGYGTPEESVTPAKVRRLRGLLVAWISETRYHAANLAIDVVGLTANSSAEFSLTHAKDVQ